jgi:hypothetical protein
LNRPRKQWPLASSPGQTNIALFDVKPTPIRPVSSTKTNITNVAPAPSSSGLIIFKTSHCLFVLVRERVELSHVKSIYDNAFPEKLYNVIDTCEAQSILHNIIIFYFPFKFNFNFFCQIDVFNSNPFKEPRFNFWLLIDIFNNFNLFFCFVSIRKFTRTLHHQNNKVCVCCHQMSRQETAKTGSPTEYHHATQQ